MKNVDERRPATNLEISLHGTSDNFSNPICFRRIRYTFIGIRCYIIEFLAVTRARMFASAGTSSSVSPSNPFYFSALCDKRRSNDPVIRN